VSAPVGTRVRYDVNGVVFTKVAEDAWQHSGEPEPRVVGQHPFYDSAMHLLEKIAEGQQERDFTLLADDEEGAA